MTNTLSRLTLAVVALAGTFVLAGPAAAQVAGGTTTVETNVTESTRLAMGWSVKKTLMGKDIYNDAGKKIGKVEDLIVAPDKNVSFVIVGAGGFVGIGRHDVAVPVTQIQDRSGKLVMAGATQETIKAMPEFTYAKEGGNSRDQFVTAADKEIAKGKAAVASLEKKLGTANPATKAKLDQQIGTLQGDLKSAEAKLSEMKQANAARWKDFEAGVHAATERLRKSIATANV